MSAADAGGAPDPGIPRSADAILLTVLCTSVRFPAPRWCLVAAAHDRGLDVATVDRLLRLPPVVESPEALRTLLARAPGHRTVPPVPPPTSPRAGVSARPAPRPGPR